MAAHEGTGEFQKHLQGQVAHGGAASINNARSGGTTLSQAWASRSMTGQLNWPEHKSITPMDVPAGHTILSARAYAGIGHNTPVGGFRRWSPLQRERHRLARTSILSTPVLYP